MNNVNHPQHYNKLPNGIECIDVVKYFNFTIGSAIKYLWRYAYKGASIEDLEKAVWYIQFEINELKKNENKCKATNKCEKCDGECE